MTKDGARERVEAALARIRSHSGGAPVSAAPADATPHIRHWGLPPLDTEDEEAAAARIEQMAEERLGKRGTR